MEKPIYFISDLHLHDEALDLVSQFEKFITTRAAHSQALYILGDLFEAWVGDDDPRPAAARVVQALRTLTQAQIPVYIIPGNRDFLLGRAFAQITGACYLPDPTCITLGSRRVLLSHGDIYCSHDLAYQRYRKFIHNPLIKMILLSLPWKLRLKLAARLRHASQDENRQKPAYLMDVDEVAIQNDLTRFKAECLIHGHTHRPQQEASRIVLGAWDINPMILLYLNDQFYLEKL